MARAAAAGICASIGHDGRVGRIPWGGTPSRVFEPRLLPQRLHSFGCDSIVTECRPIADYFCPSTG